VAGVGAEGEVEGRQVRASIRLTPEAAEVWLRLDKASRVRLGALFNELIVWYGRTSRLPVAPISYILDASAMLVKGYEACKDRLSHVEGENEKLRGEIQELKQRLATEQAYRQQIEALARQLEEEKARAQQLEKQKEQLRDRIKHVEGQIERLAQILCPHEDKIKAIIAGDSRAVVEIEALCWRRKA
jgi:DNA repair exonuclease SbcCD ATPase subunit